MFQLWWKFAPGHKCKLQQAFLIEVVKESEDGCEFISDDKEEEHVAIPEISLHALSGILTPQTMQVVGTVRGQQLHVLIDSGSTHNLVNVKFAKKLGCDKVAA